MREVPDAPHRPKERQGKASMNVGKFEEKEAEEDNANAEETGSNCFLQQHLPAASTPAPGAGRKRRAKQESTD